MAYLHPSAVFPVALLLLMVVENVPSSESNPIGPASTEESFPSYDVADRVRSRAVNAIRYKCMILQTLYQYWRLSSNGNGEINFIRKKMERLLRECRSQEKRNWDFFNQTIIFPGTKWCGQSNIAEHQDDLGIFNETDSCCRTHDSCDDVIQPGESKQNLINPYGTTRLNCQCDAELKACFRKVNSVISNAMGYIFFSVLQTQCYKLEYPAVGCKQWKRGSVRLYCVEYELEKNKPKTLQWFDQEPYVIKKRSLE